MNKHSPEPWKLEFCDGWYIVAEDGVAICDVGDVHPAESDLEKWQETGNRIVACVNGCAGIDKPEVVPEIVSALEAAWVQIEEYLDGNNQTNEDANASVIIEQIRSVLAKVRG